MKILLINKFHYLRGGAETAYFNTAKVLAEHGHDLVFFSMNHPKNIASRWSKYFIDFIDYQDKKLSLFKKIKVVLKIFYNWQAKKNLEKLIKKFRPDIAHLHNIYHQLSPSIIDTLKKYHIPIVMTLHDYKLICPNYNLLSNGKIWEKSKQDKYYKCLTDRCIDNSFFRSLICTAEAYFHKWLKIYQKIDIFISPSNFLIEKFKEFGFVGQLVYLPNCLLNFSKSITHGDKKYILYFGRLSQEKGVADLIKAYAKIYQTVDHQLIIAGDGEERKNLEQLVRNLNIFSRVKFIDHQHGGKLSNLISNATFVVIPSIWHENAPYSAIEAMALTKTVICSKIGGLSELIDDKKTGFLYPVGDIDKLANIMVKILAPDQKQFLQEIGQRAKEKVIIKNNKESYYSLLMAIYEQAIKKNKKSRY